MYNAVVLLGYSGIGKDTIANKLVADYPNLVNVKFSSLTKALLGTLVGFTTEQLDGRDKDKVREQSLALDGKDTGVSLLDLLVSLFHGSHQTNLHRANIKWAIDNIPANSIPVFTDIRRQNEMAAVRKAFTPLIIRLSDVNVIQGAADVEIDTLSYDHLIVREDVESTYANVCKLLTNYEIIKANTMDTTLVDYIAALVELNKPKLNDRTFNRTTFYFGLVEEILEFTEAFSNTASKEDLIKEAGDVLAYATLVLVDTLSHTKTLAEIADLMSSNNTEYGSLIEAALAVSGHFKRVFRGEYKVDPHVLNSALRTVLTTLADTEGVTLTEVAKTNLAKLTARANKGTMFSGSGNNR